MLRTARWRATEGGPSYDAIHCQRPEKLPPETFRGCPGCPGCALTNRYEIAYQEAARETGVLLGEELYPDDIERMRTIFGTASKSYGERGELVDPEWPMEWAHIVRIVGYERNRLEFEDSWERIQKMKAGR